MYLPTLLGYSKKQPDQFPDSCIEFGGVGYPYRVKRSPIDGLGVFSRRTIFPGEYIGEYWGKQMSSTTVTGAAVSSISRYGMTFKDHKWVDAEKSFCPMKYVNHSCDPNAAFELVGHLLIFRAQKVIEPGVEITVDYSHTADTSADLLPCKCGSARCRQFTADVGTILRLKGKEHFTK
ncbi:SET domain-containing protein [Aduncisulcus paluster]|uniref:SET domain-containing protein n=2 Tax=Aduncisulcus paluster TaxID=2918883 RepID=A0ABQ5KPI7_9EUKA|nr:SET domain-containing protein [Aduncisulcus paluster]